ncbi:MAG: CHAD domain-containing protein [Verrucomicrobiae bacterium]
MVSASFFDSECPGAFLLGVLREHADAAARDVAALPDRSNERIHDIRVGMKKFRSSLRLASEVLPSREFARLDGLAREIKGAFGTARDRDVQLGLLRVLLGERGAVAWPAAIGGEDCPAGDGTRKACESLSGLVAKLDLRQLTSGQALAAWVASYRDARRTMAACHKDPEDDFLFHKWRKRVKQVLYQSAVLGPPAADRVPGAQELSSALGSQHDLAGLLEIVPPCGPDAVRLVLEKKRETARLALGLGDRVFRNKPDALIKCLSDFAKGCPRKKTRGI